MINALQLLADLTRLLKRFEDDLRLRIADVAELKASLQAEWQAARDADRTAETFESWADQVITQAGVHWLLSCELLSCRYRKPSGSWQRPLDKAMRHERHSAVRRKHVRPRSSNIGRHRTRFASSRLGSQLCRRSGWRSSRLLRACRQRQMMQRGMSGSCGQLWRARGRQWRHRSRSGSSWSGWWAELRRRLMLLSKSLLNCGHL